MWTVWSPRGRMEIEPGDPAVPDAGIQADPGTLATLLLNPDGLDDAIANGSVHVEGKMSAWRRLIRVAT